MRIFSQFAFIPLLLTLALPASSQNPTLAETIQSIAQMQKLISQTYNLESAGEGVMNVETIALLAATAAGRATKAKPPRAGYSRTKTTTSSSSSGE